MLEGWRATKYRSIRQCLTMGAGDPVEETLAVEASERSQQRQYGDTPDGGLLAWTQVAMGHLVIFNCWGYITS